MGCIAYIISFIIQAILYFFFISGISIVLGIMLVIYIIKKLYKNKKNDYVDNSTSNYKTSKSKENIDSNNIKIIDEPVEEIFIKEENKKELSWKEEEFEREADLWGLSKEERRIAKEERMTPAEFIEAEEYDDDELLKDEWER